VTVGLTILAIVIVVAGVVVAIISLVVAIHAVRHSRCGLGNGKNRCLGG